MRTKKQLLAITALAVVVCPVVGCSSSSETEGTEAGADARDDGSSKGDSGKDTGTRDARTEDGRAEDGSRDGHAEDGPVHDGGIADSAQVDAPSDAPGDSAVPRVPVSITGTTDSRFVTAEHMLASVEMQLSGEPLAVAMGRNLSGYSRDDATPNLYFAPPGATVLGGGACAVDAGDYSAAFGDCVETDLPGFATAIESYEYSKQPMNLLAFESGAGSSYAFGPLVNPANVTGAAVVALIVPRVQHFATGSNAAPTYVHVVDGTDPTNRLGWPGFWPTLQPYRSFDPTIQPVTTVAEQCSISSEDEPNGTGSILNLDYECDSNSLHLPDRTAAIDATVTPGASGWAGWSYALHTLHYLQIMHDSAQTAIATVPAEQLAMVGAAGNTVTGSAVQKTPPSLAAVPGTYLGSSDIEGFQAQVALDELDNAAQQWLTQLTTTDGATLSGFGSIEQALQYNYASPLRWFPGAIAVTETADTSGYPKPTGYAISDAGSQLFDLLGLAGAYATAYTLTDTSNTAVGGSQPVLAFFDGDPFLADNQVADGEATLHDRALAVLRVLLVNIDRLHRDPASGLLVDSVTFSGATPTQGTTIATSSVAYAVVALRTVRRALGSQLQLSSNATPDTAIAGTITVLDGANLPLTGAPGGKPNTLVSDRIDALFTANAQLLLNSLTTADGHALSGWDVSKGAATSSEDVLDAHSAAIRGLLAAYQGTGNAAYLNRALAVFARMDSVFYDLAGLLYTSSPAPQASTSYTPLRFALLESALRELYEVAAPTRAALGTQLQNRITRLAKLVLNGWDDRNADGIVQYGAEDGGNSECITLAPFAGADAGGVQPGWTMIGHGGLQMAERALSGEIGSVCDSIDPSVCADAGAGPARQYTPDREHDCVPEIGAASLPATLANQVMFTIGGP